MVVKPKKARILLYDIETAPNLAYVWGKYEQDVIAYEDEWHMLSFAYKWLGEKRTHVMALPDFKKTYKKDKTNDVELVKALHALFSEADIVIAHNGNAFDQKKTNARMIQHGLTPPVPYKQIDTRNVARKYFKFNSNRLDDLGESLEVGRKVKHPGFEMWLGCMAGHNKSWDQMKKYNKQDVVLLEKVYEKMRPWIGGHPSLSLMEGNILACTHCGSEDLIKTGTYYTMVNQFQIWRCKACGARPRSRIPDKVGEKVKFVS